LFLEEVNGLLGKKNRRTVATAHPSMPPRSVPFTWNSVSVRRRIQASASASSSTLFSTTRPFGAAGRCWASSVTVAVMSSMIPSSRARPQGHHPRAAPSFAWPAYDIESAHHCGRYRWSSIRSSVEYPGAARAHHPCSTSTPRRQIRRCGGIVSRRPSP
jgi:hypothetical protein